jgi:hypothetical protein
MLPFKIPVKLKEDSMSPVDVLGLNPVDEESCD